MQPNAELQSRGHDSNFQRPHCAEEDVNALNMRSQLYLASFLVRLLAAYNFGNANIGLSKCEAEIRTSK